MSHISSVSDANRQICPISGRSSALAGWPRWARPLRCYCWPALIALGLHAGLFFWSGEKTHRLESVGAVTGDSGSPATFEISFSPPALKAESSEQAEEVSQDESLTLPELPPLQISPTEFVIAVEFDKPKVRVDLPGPGLPSPLSGIRAAKGVLGGSGFGEFFGQGTARTFLDGRMMATAMPPPSYPETARRDGREGSVELYVAIASTGHPARVEVLKTSGSRDLDAAARKVVAEQWRFQPPSDDATRECRVRVAFRLNQGDLALGKL